jgi:hypothetical protein
MLQDEFFNTIRAILPFVRSVSCACAASNGVRKRPKVPFDAFKDRRCAAWFAAIRSSSGTAPRAASSCRIADIAPAQDACLVEGDESAGHVGEFLGLFNVPAAALVPTLACIEAWPT